LILTDFGAQAIMNRYLNNTTYLPLTARLYTNNYTPLDTSVLGDFTEAAGGGYAAISLGTTWTVDTLHVTPAVAVHPAISYVFTGTLTGLTTVYGMYITDSSNVVIFAEKFGTPFQPRNNGDTITVNTTIQMSKGTPT